MRPAAQQAMIEVATAYWFSQMVFVAAELGVADALAKGPLALEALAGRVGAHGPSLRRVLRALASRGIFAETSAGRWKLTPLAATLRSDDPRSVRDFTRMIVQPFNWRSWGELLHGVRTGGRAFERVHGRPFFDWLRSEPEQERLFAASMASISGTENDAVARAYDFGSLRTLVDVGGAHGHLLGAILRRHRRLRGVLFDQPQVVRAAAGGPYLRDVAERCELVGGSFFESVPEGGDGYLMKYIVHDWDDEDALRILRACRKAMAPGGRVLLVEHVLRPGNAPDFGKLLDANMLVLLGGRERTREEYRDLFARAGLRLRRVVPTAGPLSVVEGVRRESMP